MTAKINFVNQEQAGFASTLRKRVDSYFTDNKISKFGNGFLAFKIVFFLSGLITFYLLLLLGNFSFPLSLVSMGDGRLIHRFCWCKYFP